MKLIIKNLGVLVIGLSLIQNSAFASEKVGEQKLQGCSIVGSVAAGVAGMGGLVQIKAAKTIKGKLEGAILLGVGGVAGISCGVVNSEIAKQKAKESKAVSNSASAAATIVVI